jgi:hypothetical protein
MFNNFIDISSERYFKIMRRAYDNYNLVTAEMK